MVLPREFYNRPTSRVARDLLGKHLVRRDERGKTRAVLITEVEAYDGFRDRASHARFGPTPRNAVMFGPPGQWYVYLCYGVHWLLNVVTREEGYPAAVLIRGAGDHDGPGKLTKALGIDSRQNLTPAFIAGQLWVEDRGIIIRSRDRMAGPRVGVAYAGPVWAAKPWRFRLADPAAWARDGE